MRISKNPRLFSVILGLITIPLSGLLMVSCKPDPTRNLSTPLTLSSIAIPTHTTIPTIHPTMTPSPTTTPTYTPTITRTPTITPTPTEDLSFFHAAECLPRDTGYQRAVAIGVLDGDTIEVQFEDGITNTVRYIGMDAPESGLPYSEAAHQADRDLVLQKELVLIKDQSDTDSFGRLLRYVVADGVFVNQDLVQKGFAKAVNYPPDEACKDTFSAAEVAAQQASIGMWASTPTPEPYSGQLIILTVNKREEWVDIQNVGDYAVDLAGWNLVSERGGQGCPLSGILQAGQVLRIWAMAAQGPGYSCGYNSPIWNNSESDPAVLYNAQGIEVSRK
jgi:micrococcal nuclease